MKIVYGINGHGRGHATTALALIPKLKEKNKVILFAGDNAYEILRKAGHKVVNVPSIRLYFKGKKVDVSKTVIENAKIVFDKRIEKNVEKIRKINPDIILSDEEIYTSIASNRLDIPLITLDHRTSYTHCTPQIEIPFKFRFQAKIFKVIFDKFLRRKPKLRIGYSFFPVKPKYENVKAVRNIIRKEAKKIRPTVKSHIVVYQGGEKLVLTEKLRGILLDIGREARIYGIKGKDHKNLKFKKISDKEFLKDFASCYMIISGAGNNIIAEAFYYSKPLILFPEHTEEQGLNAYIVEKMRVGVSLDQNTITKKDMEKFMRNINRYRKNCKKYSGDSTDEVVKIINEFGKKLKNE